ncbi:MAG: hypothetical protein WBF69_12360 [Castellaniella sp.]|uniref:hypothetical protein n=1 Tax=Castellaniella sp. TaxID=1955812 RepID=UPI003C73736B
MRKPAMRTVAGLRLRGAQRGWLVSGLVVAGAGVLLLVLWGWRQGGGELLQLGANFC